jgi:hypothetical protein
VAVGKVMELIPLSNSQIWDQISKGAEKVLRLWPLKSEKKEKPCRLQRRESLALRFPQALHQHQ